jgi:PIN domain nuclease of toxin-antitoxin system
MSGLLLDTNAAIWFMARDKMAPAALEAIAEAQSARAIFVSPISAWEAALALRKPHGKPNLGGREAAQWFREVLKVPGLKIANLTRRVALEAAQVPALFGSGDPGDCFLIATAHIKKVRIVTRDRQILRFSQDRPDYLHAIRC